ncbi:MAG TPA: PAS domain S-box protein, partial [bacterium]|nr:PAS domain S-box protein [bacterium]
MNYSGLSRDELIQKLNAQHARIRELETALAGDEKFELLERLQHIFDSIHAGLVLQDRDGVIRLANHLAAEILNLEMDALLGKTSQDPAWRMIDESGRPIKGEDHPAMITLRTGKPLQNQIRGVYAGEDESPVRWLLINTEPLFDDSKTDHPDAEHPHEVKEVLATFIDVTDRVRAEKQLRESESRFRQLIDQLPDGVFSHYSDGTMAVVNIAACRQTGYTREELMAMKVWEIDPDIEDRGDPQKI